MLALGMKTQKLVRFRWGSLRVSANALPRQPVAVRSQTFKRLVQDIITMMKAPRRGDGAKTHISSIDPAKPCPRHLAVHCSRSCIHRVPPAFTRGLEEIAGVF